MASTNFKVFNEDMNVERTFSDAEYEIATQRQSGVIPGMASSRLHNKMYHQSSAMAKAIADFLVAQGLNCMDNDIPAITAGIQSAISNAATDEIQSHNSSLTAHAGLLHLWQPTHVYAVGDICYSPGVSSYKRFECTVAGNSGAAEPVWPTVGQLVTDGTAKWIVDDIRDGTLIGNPMFDIIIRPGYLKCNGALISRAAYPRLTKVAIDNSLIVTEAIWAANGWGAFGAGDGSTTIRLPDLRGEFIRGWDDARGVDPGRVVRSAQSDAIRNITGSFDGYIDARTSLGAISLNNTGLVPAVGSSSGYHGVSFNASTVVPTANENRPRNIAYNAVIKY